MELEVTTKRVFMIWWAYCWRSVIISGGIGVLLASITDVIMEALNYSPYSIKIDNLVGFIGAVTTQIFVLKLVLKKKFHEFRIALIAR